MSTCSMNNGQRPGRNVQCTAVSGQGAMSNVQCRLAQCTMYNVQQAKASVQRTGCKSNVQLNQLSNQQPTVNWQHGREPLVGAPLPI